MRRGQPDPVLPVVADPQPQPGPAVAQVREQLARIHPDWLDQEAIDGVLDRAHQADQARALWDAVAARGGALAPLLPICVDPDTLIAAAGWDLATERAMSALPEPPVPDLTDEDLDRLTPRLAVAAHPLRPDLPEPAVAAEVRAWNFATSSGRRITGPAVTQAERQILLDRDRLVADLADLAEQLATWQTADYSSRLDRLGVLTSLHAGRSTLDERTQTLAQRTAEADQFRTDHGLTWNAETAQPVHVTA